MKLVLLQVGKTDKDYLKKGIEDFSKRIEKLIRFETFTLPDVKNRKTLSPEEQKRLEAEKILAYIGPGDTVILLDEKGMSGSSLEFSKLLSLLFNSSSKRLLFVIGGPYGFHKDVYGRADRKFSLSPLTFSHQLVRLLFVEQLYRGLAIQKGLPYHNE